MEKSEAQKEYELKKEEKLQQKIASGKKDKASQNSKKITGIIILIIIVALAFFGLKKIVKDNSPQGQDFSQSMPDAGRGHITVGTTPSEGTYTSNPPSSGPHYPNTARTGFYDVGEEVEDQFYIHNLEHGDIWIVYKPTVSEATKEVLKKFADRFVVVSSRENNPSDISLVAWNKLDNFSENDLTEERIKDFILRYDNKGPEKVRAGSGHQAGAVN